RLGPFSRRTVAWIPPAATKPSARAPAAAAGIFPFSLAFTSMPARTSSSAAASPSRSASMSRRTCSAVRPLSVAIVLQHLRRQLCLLDRLLRHRWRRLLDRALGEEAEHAGDKQEPDEDDEEREPDRGRGGDSGCDRREPEPDPVEHEYRGAHGEADPGPEKARLALELQARELELEADQGAGALGELLGRAGEAVRLALVDALSLLHGFSSRSPWPG